MQKLCRVKTEEQIKKTLDRDGRCSDVTMVGAMYRHCGEIYVARPSWHRGIWHLYDKRNRPVVSESGFSWGWVSEWLDFDSAADENDLTKIIAGGRKK